MRPDLSADLLQRMLAQARLVENTQFHKPWWKFWG